MHRVRRETHVPEVVADGSLTNDLRSRLQGRSMVRHTGRVVRAVGTSLQVSGLPVRIGQRCEIHDRVTETSVLADVVGIDKGDAVLVPLGGIQGIAVDSTVRIVSEQVTVPGGDALLGRVIDGFGQPLDELGSLDHCAQAPLNTAAPNPLQRLRIEERLNTGVKAIDTLLTVGVGQRLGIFAPAGVGKSTLLGMLAMHAQTDVIVVGLIGERGREVREFLEDALSESARKRAVIDIASA